MIVVGFCSYWYLVGSVQKSLLYLCCCMMAGVLYLPALIVSIFDESIYTRRIQSFVIPYSFSSEVRCIQSRAYIITTRDRAADASLITDEDSATVNHQRSSRTNRGCQVCPILS